MRVHVVDPSAYTRPYDHALCSALGRAGAEVELITSRLAYGQAPAARNYVVRDHFYRHAFGPAGSSQRRVAKLVEHVPDMVRYRRLAQPADVVHFQWFALQWLDRRLLPRRPLVLTAHDLLPRESRPGQAAAQRRLYDAVDAVVVHSDYGRGLLIDRLGLPPDRVHVVHHGAFTHLASQAEAAPLPAQFRHTSGPVVMFFGLLRPYKGVDLLLRAWQQVHSSLPGSELWIVGHPRMPLDSLRAAAPPGVRFEPRFLADEELPAFFGRADLVVLPYRETERFDQSGVLATALAFAKPIVLSDVGSFSEVAAAGAARLVAPGDPRILGEAISELLASPQERERLARAAGELARSRYSWDQAARRTLALYETLVG
jgi:glycosyltransferase involved in cell wall biosynthesis